ncbi:hypothetical protein J5Y03_15905 [Bacillus sp. RG28]|uniref:Uncharacterized protein n=1 Tax=Gottfriedia endophytica TaxID=2820819 RepID=A0A940NQX5_9BACI|nr:hypothetical protein [Gottfriedia endophytica]MBP0726644.1 hypothetical protein [Gottfriedia endophytica]
MKFEMQKANMLAENIYGFIRFVHKSHENSKNSFFKNTDKMYQIKLLIKEYKFQIIADELLRINRYTWDEKYTYLLLDSFIEGLNIINEYVENNYNELYIFTARLYTLKNISVSFSNKV